MSDFEREDQQVMDVVNDHASPDASARAERIVREFREQDAATVKTGTITKEVHDEACGMTQNAETRERWYNIGYNIGYKLGALIRLIIIELLGYAALGGVLVAGMIKGFIPMGVAVPAFVICFMWVAVRFDRWLRG